jgi:hypothetical protein
VGIALFSAYFHPGTKRRKMVGMRVLLPIAAMLDRSVRGNVVLDVA